MPENSKNLALKYGYFDKLRQVITYSFKYTLRKLKLKRLSMDRVTELFSTKNQKLKHSCGTVRVDPGQFPTEFKNAKLQREKFKLLKDENIIAIHCKNKQDVYAIPAIHGSEIESVGR